jgi:hypothetical protein
MWKASRASSCPRPHPGTNRPLHQEPQRQEPQRSHPLPLLPSVFGHCTFLKRRKARPLWIGHARTTSSMAWRSRAAPQRAARSGVSTRIVASFRFFITTSTFPQVARRAASADRVVPLRLVDKEELLDLLLAYRIGVRQNGKKHSRLDKELFVRLNSAFPKHQPKKASHENKHLFRVLVWLQRTWRTRGGEMT